MSRPAVAAIARWEWQRHRRALVLLGLVAGLFGGLVVAAAVLARRTITAPDRLYETVRPGDIHVQTFGGPELAEQVLTLPSIDGFWRGGVAVGRLEDRSSVQYVGILAPIDANADLFRPVVVAGRMPDPADLNQIALIEDGAAERGFDVGDRLRLGMLSAAEVFQFDTGFGEPDGPTLELTITAMIRLPPGVLNGTPVVASAAFGAAHPDLFAGNDMFATLHGGADASSSFEAEANALVEARADGGDERPDFSPFTIEVPHRGTDALLRSSGVLFGGLVAMVIIASVAVAAALAQAWARHHGTDAPTQQIEFALGLATRDRVMARMWPAAVSATIATIVSAGIGTTGSWLHPAGALDRVEAAPGFRFDAPVVAVGAMAVAVLVMVIAATTAWRAGSGSGSTSRAVQRRWWWHLVPRRRGWPLAGAAFAMSPGARMRHVPVRVSLLGGIVGVAGLVGASTFEASLDRLVATPERYGWNADFAIADIDDEVMALVAADDRFEAVADYDSASFAIGGNETQVYAFDGLNTGIHWTLLDGREPRSADEATLGPKLADRMGVGVGDTLMVGSGDPVTVVGIGLGPTLSGEELGSSALFHAEGLQRTAVTGFFREAVIRVAPGHDDAAIVAELGGRYELTVRTLPGSVRNVAELGSLPGVLGAFLAALAAAALGHALFVTGRHRIADLAVLRALGATPRQTGLAVVSMAIATLAIGAAIGVPLGWLTGRLLWAELAESIGVRGDITASITTVLLLVVALLVAIVLAIVPARRAAQLDPGHVLRTD